MSYIAKRLRERIREKKLRLDSYRPLPRSIVEKLGEQITVEFTHSSNAIEGNTLTIRETEMAITRGVTARGKTLREYREAANHPKAIEYIREAVAGGRRIDEETTKTVHGMLLDGISEDAGRYRDHGVAIGGSSWMPPPSRDVPEKMDQLFEWLDGNPEDLNGIELASIFHLRFLQVHPFSDGNGRTARLLMNLVLMRYGYPFLTNIAYRDRARYMDALGEADLNNMMPLVNVIASSVEAALDRYLRVIEEPAVLSLAEASEISGYSQDYLGLRARQGALDAFRKGSRWYITEKALKAYIESVKDRNKRG